MLLRLLFAFASILILSASSCTGGRCNTPECNTDQNSIPVEDTARIQIDSQNTEVTQVIAGYFGALEVDTGSVEIPVPSHDALITAVGKENQIVFLGLVESGTDNLTINEYTTTEALLRIVPSLYQLYLDDRELFNSIYADIDSLDELALYIQANDNWSSFSPEFMSLLSTSLNNFLAAIDSSLTPSVQVSTKAKTKFSVASVVADDPLGKVATSISVGGIDLDLDTNYVSEQRADFDLVAKNVSDRWVTVVIEDSDSVQHHRSLLKPGETLAFPSIEARNFNEIGGKFIVVGPSVRGRVLVSFGEMRQWYLDATYRTITDLLLQSGGVVTSLPTECIDINTLLLKGKAIPALEADAIAGNFEGVFLTLYDLLSNPEVYSACPQELAESEAFIIPVLLIGEFYTKLLEIGYEIGPTFFDTFQFKAFESIALFNNAYGDVTFNHEVDSTELSYLKEYEGECPEPTIGESIKCESFWFDHEGPYEIEFVVDCKEPETSLLPETTIDCISATILPGNSAGLAVTISAKTNNIGDKGVTYTAIYNDVGEYAGTIKTLDIYGAEHIKEFRIQVNKAKPKIVITRNGNPLPFIVEDDELRNSAPIEINCCEEGQTSNKARFGLLNIGLGSAFVDAGPISLGNTSFSTSDNLNQAIIAPGEEISFDITYTPSGSIDSKGSFTFNGDVGGGRSVFFEQTEYSKIKLEVAPVLDCSIFEEHVVGNWEVMLTDGSQSTPYNLEVFEDGTGKYNNKYGMNWKLARWDEPLPSPWSTTSSPLRPLGVEEGCIFYDTGFWHFAFSGYVRSVLQYPVTGFIKYDLGGPGGWPSEGNYFGTNLEEQNPVVIYTKL